MITPVEELMVATLGLAELQVPPATVELKVVPAPRQTVCMPLNVPAPIPVIVTVLVATASEQDPVPFTV